MIDKQLFKIDGAGSILKKLAGLEILQAFFIVGQALALASVLSKLWAGESLDWLLLLTFAACFIARQLINTLRDSMLEKYSGQVAEELRQKLLDKVFRDGQALVQKQGTGSLITMSLDGVDEVRQYIKLIYSKVLTMMIVPVLIFVGMLFLSWTSAVILLVMYPLIVLFMIILGHAAQDRAIKQFGNFQVLSNNFIDSLRGIDTLKYLGLSKRYSKSIFNLSEGFRKKTMAVLKVAMLSTFALDFFTTLSIAIIAVFLGFDLMNGKIALFPALGILILAPDYFLPIRDFAGDFHATLNGKNAFKRINELINLPEEKTNDLSLKTWSAQDQLKIKNLKFTYQKGTEIGPVSLQVQGFKKIGIIGMSGSGKTSLINLLSGFLTPDQVQIELQGQKTTTMNIPAWQRQMTYIPQEPYVFTKSLRENIAFYNPQASDDEIKQAIHIMGLDALLNDLPNGLDTVIGRGKRVLSGGQSQRIALARAFLDPKRKIMIFDEPTAHLDIETEIDLKKRMMPLMQNKLVFFATHRLHWLKEMDYILVMDHGQLVEQGSYEQLQQNQGYFCKLMAGMRGENNDQ
ncbi:thiol reductant ABC exporter subunit CydD [Lactobacillus crispatus]|jgi:thiol reductant ABC exporter, cydD subunit|uniref:Thiol reductant ABC exporter subunit CydD n=3 Tax=Lactobacillus crispatus TaxID=47770 RepID=A0A135Z7I2_9LACO|nr:thiol reductant ABC exporter subunit CydD [Lactobacillus crispatus]STX16009.1 ABC transporter, ATP-binding protein cydd [Lactobacillus acidophilus]EEJ70895.1 thiol reductant ABC exporter, CydD subunit [Lactobacillus crispatus JV-V01]EEU28155.1 thiol reductant ABC exporter, CydD subunit [Lactobacillus crispatus MV-1A-US]KWU04291.1 cysteine ABC transporter ATP-binding protein [Lactobacillus crispatus]KWU12436.1 cysteine ABC transporter ATP-binding protein [Lactobacillus crispatus]